MKQGKRILSLLLTLAIALALAAAPVGAAELNPEEGTEVVQMEEPERPEEAALEEEAELAQAEPLEEVPEEASPAPEERAIEPDSQAEAAVPVEEAGGTVTLDSEDGDKESDIQKALKNADEGDVIRLKGSFKFTSTLKLYSGVTLDAGSASITHSGDVELLLNLYKIEGCTVKGGKWKAGSSTRVVKLSGCEGCTLSGMDISGGDGEDPSGSVYVYNSEATTVENCSFSNTRSQALYANKSRDFVAANCTFTGIGGYGIHTYYSDDPVLVGNTISDCCGDGIYSSHSVGGICSGNRISDTTANGELDIDSSSGEARSGNGIFLSGCEDYFVGKSHSYGGETYVGNVLTNSENYGIHLNVCDGTDIYQLTSDQSGNDGVHISASDRTTVRSCVIKSAKKAGISTTPGKRKSKCQDSVLADNQINTCSTYGLWVNQSDNTQVVGNQITKSEKDGIHCSNSATNVKISGNTVTKTTDSAGSGIGIYSCTSTAIGDTITVNGKEYQKNTVKSVKKYGVDVSKSDKTKVKYCAITATSNTGIRISESDNCSVYGNSVKTAGSRGIYVTKSKKASVKKNTIKAPEGKGIQVSDSSGCNVKTVNVPTINKVTEKTTVVKGKITKGSSVKVKAGDQYYACTVDGTSFTSKKIPKQKKGTTLYLREYPGGSNSIITPFQVK